MDFAFAMDALQVVVHKNNPITHVTLPELEAIYAENPTSRNEVPITTWSQVGDHTDYAHPLTIYG